MFAQGKNNHSDNFFDGAEMMTGLSYIESYSMPDFSMLPNNIAHWKIDPQRAVLLVHDMQQYFVRPLSKSNLKDTLIKNITLLRQYCQTHRIPVAFTLQPGRMTKRQRGLLHDFWGNGMTSTQCDQAVVDTLKPEEKDWLITKWRYSAFCRTDLLDRMRASKRDQIILCGVYAHIGVLMTAVDAFSNDIETFLMADAVADFSHAKHLMALNYASQCCAVVLHTHEAIT